MHQVLSLVLTPLKQAWIQQSGGLYFLKQPRTIGAMRVSEKIETGGRPLPLRVTQSKTKMYTDDYEAYSDAYYCDDLENNYSWAHDDHKQAKFDAIFAEQDLMEAGGEVNDDASELKEIIIIKNRLEQLITEKKKIDCGMSKKMMSAPEFVPGKIPCAPCNECYGDVLLEPEFKDTDGKYYCTSCWDKFTDDDSVSPPPVLECDPQQLSVPALQIKLRVVLGAGAVLPKKKPELIKMFRNYYM
jgi:hypothetical protein